MAALRNGITVLDVHDPLYPGAELDLSRAGLRPGVIGRYLFAGDDFGVNIIDAGNPVNPQEAGSQQLTDCYGLEISAINLKVYADVLYVATDRIRCRRTGY